jgi:hypothetical protein
MRYGVREAAIWEETGAMMRSVVEAPEPWYAGDGTFLLKPWTDTSGPQSKSGAHVDRAELVEGGLRAGAGLAGLCEARCSDSDACGGGKKGEAELTARLEAERT